MPEIELKPIIKPLTTYQEHHVISCIEHGLRKGERRATGMQRKLCILTALFITINFIGGVLCFSVLRHDEATLGTGDVSLIPARIEKCIYLHEASAKEPRDHKAFDSPNTASGHGTTERAQVLLCSNKDAITERVLFGDPISDRNALLQITQWSDPTSIPDDFSTVYEKLPILGASGGCSISGKETMAIMLLGSALSRQSIREGLWSFWITIFTYAAIFNSCMASTGVTIKLDPIPSIWFPDTVEKCYKGPCSEVLHLVNCGGYKLLDSAFQEEWNPGLLDMWSAVVAKVLLHDATNNDVDLSQQVTEEPAIANGTERALGNSGSNGRNPCIRFISSDGFASVDCSESPLMEKLGPLSYVNAIDMDWKSLSDKEARQHLKRMDQFTIDDICFFTKHLGKRAAFEFKKYVKSGVLRICSITGSSVFSASRDRTHWSSNDALEPRHLNLNRWKNSDDCKEENYQTWATNATYSNVRGIRGWIGVGSMSVIGWAGHHVPVKILESGDIISRGQGTWKEENDLNRIKLRKQGLCRGNEYCWWTEKLVPEPDGGDWSRRTVPPQAGMCATVLDKDGVESIMCVGVCSMIEEPWRNLVEDSKLIDSSIDKCGCDVYQLCWNEGKDIMMATLAPPGDRWSLIEHRNLKMVGPKGDKRFLFSRGVNATANSATYLFTEYGPLFTSPVNAYKQNNGYPIGVLIYRKGATHITSSDTDLMIYDEDFNSRKKPFSMKDVQVQQVHKGEFRMTGYPQTIITNGTTRLLFDECLAKYNGGDRLSSLRRAECHHKRTRIDNVRLMISNIMIAIFGVMSAIYLCMYVLNLAAMDIGWIETFETLVFAEGACMDKRDGIWNVARKYRRSKKMLESKVKPDEDLDVTRSALREIKKSAQAYIWQSNKIVYVFLKLIAVLPSLVLIIMPMSIVLGLIVWVLDLLLDIFRRLSGFKPKSMQFSCYLKYLIHICGNCRQHGNMKPKTTIALWVLMGLYVAVLVPVGYAEKIAGQSINIKTNCDDNACIGTFIANFKLQVSTNLTITFPLVRGAETVGKIEVSSKGLEYEIGLDPLWSTTGWAQTGSSVTCVTTEVTDEKFKSGDCLAYYEYKKDDWCGCAGCYSVNLPLQKDRENYLKFPTYCRTWDPKGFWYCTDPGDGYDFLGVGVSPRDVGGFFTYRGTSHKLRGEYTVKVVVDGSELVSESITADSILDTFTLDGIDGSIRAVELPSGGRSLNGEMITCFWPGGVASRGSSPPSQCWLMDYKSFQDNDYLNCEGVPNPQFGCKTYSSKQIDRKYQKCEGQKVKSFFNNAGIEWEVASAQYVMGQAKVKPVTECNVGFKTKAFTPLSEERCSNRALTDETTCINRGEYWGPVKYQMPNDDELTLSDCSSKYLEFSISGEANLKLGVAEIEEANLASCTYSSHGCYGKPSGFEAVIDCDDSTNSMLRVEPITPGVNCPSALVMTSGRAELQCSVPTSEVEILISSATGKTTMTIKGRDVGSCATWEDPEDCVDCDGNTFAPWESLEWWEIVLIILSCFCGLIMLRLVISLITPFVPKPAKTIQVEAAPQVVAPSAHLVARSAESDVNLRRRKVEGIV